jgi:hypothetical protein
MFRKYKPTCLFCGAEVGDVSQQTEEKVTAIYYCVKCKTNYCDQCSYHKDKKPEVQLCLRCKSELEKVT